MARRGLLGRAALRPAALRPAALRPAALRSTALRSTPLRPAALRSAALRSTALRWTALRSAAVCAAALGLLCAAPARGAAQATTEATRRGYELALYGQTAAAPGTELRVGGTAYAVRGLADLSPMAGATIVARITRAVTDEGRARRETAVEVSAAADPRGRFVVALPVPDALLASPQLEVVLRQGDDAGRTWVYPLGLQPALRFDVLADRRLYEPGETVHLWARLVDARSDRPAPRREVRLRIHDPSGRTLHEATLRTSAAGVATVSHALPQSALDGAYRVTVEAPSPAATSHGATVLMVGRRTVERLLLEVELDQDVVPPAGFLTGRVKVRSPSGAPIAHATVELRAFADGEATTLQTDAEGVAPYRVQAPAFLSGNVATHALTARISHAAHGTLHAAKSYMVSRVEWLVSAVAGAHALVPEVDDVAYVSVVDVRGEPAPSGTEVEIEGPAVRGGRASAVLDAHGLAAVALRVPAGAAAPVSGNGAGCDGNVATVLEITVRGAHAAIARACVQVAPEAEVLPVTRHSVVRPGDSVQVEVRRRPAVRARPVLVEALAGGRAIAWTWVEGAQSEGSLALPDDFAGVVEVRARALHETGARAPASEEGSVELGTGAITAVLVRPGDAFSLAVEAQAEPHEVRGRARVGLRATPAADGGWVALLARDLAAHGGERPFEIAWVGGAIDRATADPGADGAELLLRTALAGGVRVDPPAIGPPPLVPPPWRPSTRAYGESSARGRGQLRDPVALREELLRRGVGRIMQQLEAHVARLGVDPAAGRGIVRRAGARIDFDPAVIENLVGRRVLSESLAQTLGGERLTVAMLEAADPSFSFDTVARRVTRARLMRLMVALAAFSSPEDPNAARASAGEPPARWLSRMVQLGIVPADALVDAWGGAFVFRPAAGGRPELVISERAATYELVSPGPDGRPGTGDDLRDPFLRVVAEGTPYAVASGEDALLQRLSMLSAGQRVLAAMVQAYATLGLAAEEERRAGPVTATASEDAPAMDGLALEGTGRGGGGMGEGTIGLGALGTIGHGGGGGSGQGYGRGAGRASRSMPAAQSPAPAEMEADDELARAEQQAQGRRQRAAAPAGGSRIAVMGEMIRERFPATLHFVGEARLEASGLTTIEVPLADALTTYRIEAIGWTASGWSAVASGEVRVDQEASVDAPVPAHVTAGDVLRIPVRVSNRTGRPLSARVEITAEGELRIEADSVLAVEVSPRESREVVVSVRVPAPGEGALVVRAVKAAGGAPLDAVRRPMRALEDARLVRERREVLVSDGASLALELPAEASERGPGQLRVAVGSEIFGDPSEWARESRSLRAAWALAIGRRSIPAEASRYAVDLLTHGELEEPLYGEPEELALAISATWRNRAVSDAWMRRALRAVSEVLGGEDAEAQQHLEPEEREELDIMRATSLARVLLHLAPAVRSRGRMALRADTSRLVGRLRRAVGDAAARASEDSAVWAEAAAALALTRGASRDRRAEELVRRASRDEVRVGDQTFLESADEAGYLHGRLLPTAHLAIARAALGERGEALRLVRHLAGLARTAHRWQEDQRAAASAAADLLAAGARGSVRVRVDGRAVEPGPTGPYDLPGIGVAGTHSVELSMASGAVAMATLELRYGLPWSVAPTPAAHVELEIEGPFGARDTRAGVTLAVVNRSARVLVSPVAEIDLPAGAELDEPTREALEALAATRPTVEGRTLRVELRPLAPGATLRLPLPVRWSVAGALRGFGVAVADEAHATGTARPTAILPSRTIELPDEGAEPAAPQAEVPAPPRPRPPDPIPLPEPLAPVAMRAGTPSRVRS